MSAVEASSVRVQSMADGTLRLTVDIEPRNAIKAFSLFGSPGTAMALAALKVPAAEPEPEKPKGGPLAKLAGMWCADPVFQGWMGAISEDHAAQVVRDICGIKSRAELDSDQKAAEWFNEFIRDPYSKHLIAMGVIE